MSHNKDLNNETIIQIGCPVLGSLIPNKWYLFTGLSQGTLGLFDVLSYSLDSNTLSENITIYPIGYSQGWEAHIDWTDCQLTYIHDNYNNRIYGKTNIGNFRWFSSTVQNNILSDDSSIIFGMSTSVLISFQDNIIENNSILNLTSGRIVQINQNVFRNSVTLTVAGSITNDITILQSVFDAFVTMTINPSSSVIPIGIIEILKMNLRAFSVLQISNTAIFRLWEGTLRRGSIFDASSVNIRLRGADITNGSAINILASATGFGTTPTLLLQEFRLQEESTVTVDTATFNLSVRLEQISLSKFSTLRVHGIWDSTSIITLIQNLTADNLSKIDLSGSSPGQTINFREWSLTNESTLNAGTQGTLRNISLENGILNTNNFSLTNARLEDSTSTLIGNLTNATKSGYINPLP